MQACKGGGQWSRHGGKSIVFARIELYVGNGVKAFILTSSLGGGGDVLGHI